MKNKKGKEKKNEKYFKDIHNEEYVGARINIDYVGYNQCVSKTYSTMRLMTKIKHILLETHI